MDFPAERAENILTGAHYSNDDGNFRRGRQTSVVRGFCLRGSPLPYRWSASLPPRTLQSSLDLRFVVPQTHEVVVVERCDGDLLLRGDLARALATTPPDVARVLLRPRRRPPRVPSFTPGGPSAAPSRARGSPPLIADRHGRAVKRRPGQPQDLRLGVRPPTPPAGRSGPPASLLQREVAVKVHQPPCKKLDLRRRRVHFPSPHGTACTAPADGLLYELLNLVFGLGQT